MAREFAKLITLKQVLDIYHDLNLLTRALLGEVVRHMLLEVIGDADRHDFLISEVLKTAATRRSACRGCA